MQFTAPDNTELAEAPGQSAWNPCGQRRELWRVSHAGNRTEENLFKHSSRPRSHVKSHLGGAVTIVSRHAMHSAAHGQGFIFNEDSRLHGYNAVMPTELSVSCAGDLVTVGGSVVAVTPVRSCPGPFSFCLRSWELECFFFFCPGEDSLALWPSWVLERWWCGPDAESGTLALRTHTGREREVHCRFTLCFNFAAWPLDWAPPPGRD